MTIPSEMAEQIRARLTMLNAHFIECCVSDCAKEQDHRGRWRQGRKLAEQLLATGSTPTIAEATARAAVAVGTAIAVAARRAGVA